MWKRRKDALYLGSFHGGELLEMYGLTGDHLGTDAIGTHMRSRTVLLAIEQDCTSQLHQPP